LIAGLWTRLFGGTVQQPDRTYTIPEGKIVYAIGDIHGRLDLLQTSLAAIESHAARQPAWWTKRIVFLGDYLDRGPDSAGVIDRLSNRPLSGFDCTALKGNHEQAMLEFLDADAPDPTWLRYGGVAALASYGIAVTDRPLAEIRDEMRARLPYGHIEFLRQLKLYVLEGDYLFVHAGVRPGIPLENQTTQDFLWIRDSFLRHESPHPWRVVHGHSISEIPEIRHNRIGIDTGAYASGVLTTLVLWQDRIDFL
jgi:serine/threonine protein phosphatase 1